MTSGRHRGRGESDAQVGGLAARGCCPQEGGQERMSSLNGKGLGEPWADSKGVWRPGGRPSPGCGGGCPPVRQGSFLSAELPGQQSVEEEHNIER